MMKIGIFSKTFPAPDVDACFAAVVAAGYRAVQFNFASAGLPSLPEAIPDQVVEDIAGAADRHGMDIVAVSCTFNMIHPDGRVVEAGLACLDRMASRVRRLGCDLLTLCTGTCDPDDQWRHHPDNDLPAAWKKLVAVVERALAVAERENVVLGIEPEFANVVSSAARARDLIDEMRSGRLKIVFDAANLFETATIDEQRRIVSAAVDLLGDDIALAHAKDRLADGSFAPAGTGVLDYRHYLRELRRIGYAGCLVTHGLSAAEAPTTAAMLARHLAEE